ncbi:hypothetical protein PoB_006948500 [Plakobranchus ocellatus]|uniref:Uncharacterized protein n=1 Tax=Plakobranchus ocellatus TaxID=259542 RepID=A0AAV4DG63_9GAST|nr:hypothetical protein PoB_006948500 [Plakobranchus ocellatus]
MKVSGKHLYLIKPLYGVCSTELLAYSVKHSNMVFCHGKCEAESCLHINLSRLDVKRISREEAGNNKVHKHDGVKTGTADLTLKNHYTINWQSNVN